jgi:hypothetical protein
MRTPTSVLSATIAIAIAGAAMAQMPTPTPVDCEAARCSVQDAIDACTANPRNHGQCVSCVAHALRQTDVPRQCRGKIVRCAARSTCGKSAFETCRTESAGTCDTTTGACTDGALAAGLTSCTQDAGCVATSCKIMRAFAPHTTATPGMDQCTLAGGTPGTGSCCAACPAPAR